MRPKVALRRSCAVCTNELEGSESSCRACGTVAGEPLECEQHPERRAEAVCVVCGIPLCPTCRNGSAIPALCRAEDHAVIAAEWVRLFRSYSEFEGDCVARNMEARGIPVRLFSSRTFSGAPAAGASDVVRVFVKRDDVDRAGSHLREIMGPLEDKPDNVD